VNCDFCCESMRPGHLVERNGRRPICARCLIEIVKYVMEVIVTRAI